MTVEDDGALCENLRFFKRDPEVRQAARDLENNNLFFLLLPLLFRCSKVADSLSLK
jgi:hypothetical protein